MLVRDHIAEGAYLSLAVESVGAFHVVKSISHIANIITACDKLLLSLNDASENARFMKATLINMKKSF